MILPKINFDDIQKAMEDVVRDTFDYFLDVETGEVMTFSDEILVSLVTAGCVFSLAVV